MALNIKNREVEQLAAEVANLTGETKTEAIRQALAERKTKLAHQLVVRPRSRAFLSYLEEEIWPQLAPERLGHPPTRREREEILGYGPEGV